MIRYYVCPIIGTGAAAVRDPLDPEVQLTPADDFRPALADVSTPAPNYATIMPVRQDHVDGRPRFAQMLVCVNTDATRHALIAALPGVEDALDGLLTAETSREELLATLRSRRFETLPLADQTAKRARHAALAVAHPTNPERFTVRAGMEDGDLERWMDGLVQQQRRAALARELFVSA